MLVLLWAVGNVARPVEDKVASLGLDEPDIESALAASASNMHVLHFVRSPAVPHLVLFTFDLAVFSHGVEFGYDFSLQVDSISGPDEEFPRLQVVDYQLIDESFGVRAPSSPCLDRGLFTS